MNAETKQSMCDCELSHNGVGLTGRECDCPSGSVINDGWQAEAEAQASALAERAGLNMDDYSDFMADLETTLIEFAEWAVRRAALSKAGG